eukprot:gene46315-61937_t
MKSLPGHSAVAATTRSSGPVLTANDIKEVSIITGYDFYNNDILQLAFVHSSLSGTDTTFERLESLGDGLIKGIITDSLDIKNFPTEAEMHNFVKSKTENVYFAQRYEALGLSKFLKANPDSLVIPASVSEGGKGYKKAYADGFEALIGAIKVDWDRKYPNLQRTGRVFRVLTPVINKMVLSQISVSLTRVIAVSKPSKKSVTVTDMTSAKANNNASKNASKNASNSITAALKSTTTRVTITINGSDIGVVTQSAKGTDETAARSNAIRVYSFWEGKL